jgi:hypothetical protein
VVHAAVPLLLVSERRWLKRLQNTLAMDEAFIPTEVMRSDVDEVVAPLRLPAYLAEQNAIRHPAVDIDREGVPVQEATREAVLTQEVNLGLVQRISSVFPVLSRRVLNVRTWDTTTGTVILGADRHPNYRFRVEFPVKDDEGDAILLEHIGSVSGGEENEGGSNQD